MGCGKIKTAPVLKQQEADIKGGGFQGAMLSEENYKALLRFRDGLVPNDRKLTEREEYLKSSGYIQLINYRAVNLGNGFTQVYDPGSWKITAAGEDALKEFEDAAKKMAEDNAKHEEEKRTEQLQAAKDKKQSFRHDFKVAIFSAVFVYILDHFQDIFNLIQKIFGFFFHG